MACIKASSSAMQLSRSVPSLTARSPRPSAVVVRAVQRDSTLPIQSGYLQAPQRSGMVVSFRQCGCRPRPSVACQAAVAAAEASLPERGDFDNFVERLTTLFPLWVLLGALVGITKPSAIAWLTPDLFTVALGFLMLSMGLTLTVEDFKKCISNPVPIGVGYLGQYLIKPLLGFTIAKVLNLSPALATGLILVSCCPGGQASNVATYIAHGDVALSVLMTTASTVGAIFMTPLLTKLLAGSLVPVDAAGLALSTFQVVLLPTVVGVAANELFPSIVKKITRVLPLIGVVITTLLCASPVGQVSGVLKTMGGQLAAPVALLHAAAFALGYWLPRALGFNEKTNRTVSIETGMQSAALGFMLAQAHFADPLVAVPSAVSVVFMALGGSGLAVYWRGKPTNDVYDAAKKEVGGFVDDISSEFKSASSSVEDEGKGLAKDLKKEGKSLADDLKGEYKDAKSSVKDAIDDIKRA